MDEIALQRSQQQQQPLQQEQQPQAVIQQVQPLQRQVLTDVPSPHQQRLANVRQRSAPAPVDDAPAGKHHRQRGQLEQREVVSTHSDVQRSAFKQNLLTLVASDETVSGLSRPLRSILKTLRQYAQMDVVAGSKQKEILQERNLLGTAIRELRQRQTELDARPGDASLAADRQLTKIYLDYLCASADGYLQVPTQAGSDVMIMDQSQLQITGTYKQAGIKKPIEMQSMVGVPLFAHEPSVLDICQGALGDCYLLAGLSALVHQSPQDIKACMRDNGPTVTVRFYTFQGDVRQTMYVTVPKTVPKGDIYASGALWVQMIEHAYAASGLHVPVAQRTAHWKPSYNDIEGGTCGAFLQALTGRRETVVKLENTSDGHTLNQTFDHMMDWRRKQFTQASSQQLNALLEQKREVDLQLTAELAEPEQTAERLQAIDRLRQESAQLKAQAVALQNRISLDASPMSNLAKMIQMELTDFTDPNCLRASTMLNNVYDALKAFKDPIRAQGTAKDGTVVSYSATSYNQQTIKAALRSFTPDLIKDIPELTKEQNLAWKTLVLRNLENYIEYMSDQEMAHAPFSGVYGSKAMEIYQTIEQSLEAGKMVTLGTHKYVPKKVTGAAGRNAEQVQAGLAEGHAFTVLGVKTMGQNRYVKVRNPWDTGTRTYMRHEDDAEFRRQEGQQETHGVFLLELNEFMMSVERLHIN